MDFFCILKFKMEIRLTSLSSANIVIYCGDKCYPAAQGLRLVAYNCIITHALQYRMAAFACGFFVLICSSTMRTDSTIYCISSEMGYRNIIINLYSNVYVDGSNLIGVEAGAWLWTFVCCHASYFSKPYFNQFSLEIICLELIGIIDNR